jgi:hypothetical protein
MEEAELVRELEEHKTSVCACGFVHFKVQA